DDRREAARLGLTSGRPAEAREYLPAPGRAGPHDAELAKLRARCDAVEGKSPDAAKSYEAAARLAPRDAEVAEERAALLRDKLEDPAGANDEMDRLVRASEGAAPARLAAGRY